MDITDISTKFTFDRFCQLTDLTLAGILSDFGMIARDAGLAIVTPDNYRELADEVKRDAEACGKELPVTHEDVLAHALNTQGLTIYDTENGDTFTLTAEGLDNAVVIASSQDPELMGRFFAGEEDAADSFDLVQFGLFGDVVYG